MKFFAIFLFCFLMYATCIQAQDKIITMNGDTLLCKIKREDANQVTFSVKRNDGEWVETFLNKSDVQSIVYNPKSKKTAPVLIRSNDFIVLKNGGRIESRITSEDSTTVAFEMLRNEK